MKNLLLTLITTLSISVWANIPTNYPTHLKGVVLVNALGTEEMEMEFGTLTECKTEDQIHMKVDDCKVQGAKLDITQPGRSGSISFSHLGVLSYYDAKGSNYLRSYIFRDVTSNTLFASEEIEADPILTFYWEAKKPSDYRGVIKLNRFGTATALFGKIQ